MLFDSKSTNDFSSVPLLLCSDMSRGVKVERNETKLNDKSSRINLQCTQPDDNFSIVIDRQFATTKVPELNVL